MLVASQQLTRITMFLKLKFFSTDRDITKDERIVLLYAMFLILIKYKEHNMHNTTGTGVCKIC